MGKRKLAVLLVFLLVFSLAASQVYAVENETEEVEEDESINFIITPDSPFYYLKLFLEDVNLLLTFDPEKKAAYLAELVEERDKELAALYAQYENEDLTEEQLEILEKALDNLISYVERLIESLAALDDPDEGEDMDEGIEEEHEKVDKDAYADKYLWRIAHLEAIAEQAPEAAQMGLARAMANAERQRARAIEQGKIVEDEDEDEDDITVDIGPEDDDEEDVAGGLTELQDKEKGKGNGNGPPSSVPGKGKGLQKVKGLQE